MKRILLSLAVLLSAVVAAQAQNHECCKGEKHQHEQYQGPCQKCKDAGYVVKIEDDNIFSHCFKDIDVDGDGLVTYCEAEKATRLILDTGGRSNIIENYDFLKFFPNLTILSVGNTPLEEIDLHYQTKLEKLNLSNALWVKKIFLAENCKPEISGKDDVEITRK
ncbi:MAG: hypothetical protein J5610_00705 [Prevotella sp.]|nr:hypothetical protein [Prevotella sp.]